MVTTPMDADNVGALRTRSKVGPDWTVEESLILVNEVSAVEGDFGDTLTSFQKLKIIVENCNALGVNRNLNQCRRKWDSLLSDYRRIKHSGSKKASFNSKLFNVIERYVRDYEEEFGTDPDSESEPAPEIVPVVMAGVLGIYGLIIVVIISTGINPKAKFYYLFDGYAHLSSGLACGLASLSVGWLSESLVMPVLEPMRNNQNCVGILDGLYSKLKVLSSFLVHVS